MKKKILVIGAHPDDETFGMGGTIVKHTSNGDTVQVMIITDGSSSQYKNYKEMIKKKKQESKKAMDILGVEKIQFGTLPDMKLDTIPHININKLIEEKINSYQPEIVYTHHWSDINKDHCLIFESTMVALRPGCSQNVKKILCYETPSSTEWKTFDINSQFNPNVFTDITEFFNKKVNAIKEYKTELRPYPHPRSIESVKTYDKKNGIVIGRQYAERFQLVRCIQ